MATIPAPGHISNAARTVGEEKADLEAIVSGLRQVPGAAQVEVSKTISGDSITPDGGAGVIVLDTQGAASTDDLRNIVTTNIPDGGMQLFRNTNSGRVVVVKNLAGGAGQINLDRGLDYVLEDTTQWLLLQRRGADWFEVLRGPQRINTPIVAKTSSYTVLVSDRNRVIDCTPASLTMTLTLPPVASLPVNGYRIYIRNSATNGGTVVLDGNASETINGATTLTMYQGEEYALVCDGSSWKTVGRRTGMIKILSQTLSGASAADFTVGIGSDFEAIMFEITDLTVGTNAAILYMRLSQDGGSTYKSGASDYNWNNTISNANVAPAGGALADAQINLSNIGIGNANATYSLNGQVYLFNPGGASLSKQVKGNLSFLNSAAGALVTCNTTAILALNQAAVNAVRFLMSTGTFSGTITAYGIRR